VTERTGGLGELFAIIVDPRPARNTSRRDSGVIHERWRRRRSLQIRYGNHC